MSVNVAIVGATGAVGQEFKKVLEKRNFPVNKIRFLASSRSAGKEIIFKGEKHIVEELKEESFKGIDIALFSAGSSISKEYAPIAVKAGAVVVDNSSAFRMHEDVPLVIPEINPEDIETHKGIIANPNCSTIIMAVPVWPLHKAFKVKRIVVATYQAASGAGWKAMEELIEQTKDVLAGKQPQPKVLPHVYAFNLFSHNSKIDSSGYNEEERKMINETKKIFHTDDILITATCVRVPVLRAHSEAINITFENKVEESDIREVLKGAAGIKIVDDRERNYFPMPIDASEKDDILVGRIRKDLSQPDGRGIDMFVCGDQLLKGAALNAVQIAELLPIVKEAKNK